MFAVIVQDAQLGGTSTIIAATYLTVGLSVLLHVLSSAPLVNGYVDWYRPHQDDGTPSMQSKPAPEFRARGPVPHAAIADRWAAH